MRFVGLLGSGLLSSIVLMALASQRIEGFSGETVVFLLTFLQWQTFGLTVAKMGIDQVIFAIESGDQSIRFDIRHFVVTRSLPLAVVVSVVIGGLLTPWAGLIAFASILFDVYSLAVSSELNARQRFLPVVVSNFLNYPLFFAFGLAGSQVVDDSTALFGAFVASSLIRMIWLVLNNQYEADLATVRFSSARPMFIQQVFNHLMFRVDQLLLPLVGGILLLTQTTQERYVFMFKFPEFIASGINIIAILAFPTLLRSVAWSESRFRVSLSRKQAGLALLVSGGVMAVFLAYQVVWGGTRDAPYWIIAMPYLINGLLILPVNAITYSYLAGERVGGLIRNQVLSLIGGTIVVIALLVGGSSYALAALVPVQLISFLILSVTVPAGTQRQLYS